MSDNQEKRPAKRKSLVLNLEKRKKAREEENKHLGAFMLNLFKSDEKREEKDDTHDTDKKLGNEAEVCEITGTSNISNPDDQGTLVLDTNVNANIAGEDKGPEIIEIQTNSIEQHSQTVSSDDEVENIDLGETILHDQ